MARVKIYFKPCRTGNAGLAAAAPSPIRFAEGRAPGAATRIIRLPVVDGYAIRKLFSARGIPSTPREPTCARAPHPAWRQRRTPDVSRRKGSADEGRRPWRADRARAVPLRAEAASLSSSKDSFSAAVLDHAVAMPQGDRLGWPSPACRLKGGRRYHQVVKSCHVAYDAPASVAPAIDSNRKARAYRHPSQSSRLSVLA